VPLEAESPEAAVRLFQRHLNRVLNRVLTAYRLEFWKVGPVFYLSFLANDELIAVKLKRPWHLFLSQTVDVSRVENGQYRLKTVEYVYRIQSSPSIADEAFVRFEYVGPKKDPNFKYCRNHVQFHRDYRNTVEPFSPCDFHIPTGWVTIEHVIKFLITDLKVPPLIHNWRQILNESEKQFREWTARTV
jgi:hypothetical protein